MRSGPQAERFRAVRRGIAGFVSACALLAFPAPGGEPAGDSWPAFAKGPDRRAVADILPDLAAPAWIRGTDESTNLPISFLGQAGVIASRFSVFAVGRVTPPGQGDIWKLFCFAREDGSQRWATPVPPPAPPPNHDSWSCPVYDRLHRIIIYASDFFVTALDAQDGHIVWQTRLQSRVVNASPLITSDLGDANRLFITDYRLTSAGRLYCINIDPYNATTNPFMPGAIVWSVEVGGTTGNSPAYLPQEHGGLGLVYVSTTHDSAAGPGEIMAFPVAATAAPMAEFRTPSPSGLGFFSGLCVCPSTTGTDPYLLAASYSFYGGYDSSDIIKISARTGQVIWTASSNRTSTIPVSLPGGFIALSGGIEGYGTLPSVELFLDLGDSVEPVWNSAVASWNDSNGNGAPDPGEYLAVGGWTVQPVGIIGSSTAQLLVSSPLPGIDASVASNDLYVLDLSCSPSHPAFVAGRYHGCGGSPAVFDGTVYSVGPSGLHAFGSPRSPFDVNRDSRVTVDDLYAWTQATGVLDVNGDGTANELDRALLLAELRRTESAIMVYERP